MADVLTPGEKVTVLKQAIAAYLGCEAEEIGNFVFGCERQKGEAVLFSAGWSALAHWYLIGLADELRAMLEKNRNPQAQQAVQTALPPELQAILDGGGRLKG